MSISNTVSSAAPLYVQFARLIQAQIKALGLPEPTSAPTPSGFPENDGWFFVEFGPHGGNTPALIVPKSKTRMGNLHSHIDLSGASGYIALPKKNGRVVCHFEPDVSKVSKVLSQFVSASKRPVMAPVRRLSNDSQPAQAVASQAPVVSLVDMFPGLDPGAQELASWDASQAGAEPNYSDDEADEALQALNI